MPYRDEFLKLLAELRQYGETWENDPDEALKFKNIMRAKEVSHQLGRFMSLLSNSPELFGGKEKYNAFIKKHADLFPTKRFPTIITSPEHGRAEIDEADYEKILDALDEEFKDRPEVLENLFFKKASPDYRAANHPFAATVDAIKKDVDTLYEEEEAKKDLKDALDFANEEMVEKTGPNLVDNAIDANSNKRRMAARREFENFVVNNGMDPNKVKNQSTLLAVISPGLRNHPERYAYFKPFLDMGISFDQDYKNKLMQLDALCQQEGLLTKAQGGEKGFKEYGLADYFQKNYALKNALLDYGKLEDPEQKKTALAQIKTLTEDVKTVTAKYEKVFDFIEKNFDLEHVSLPGNIYSGRPTEVPSNGDLSRWKPNLPPKFDFEKSPAVIFLSGFTQLKAASQVEEVALEEYMDHPDKALLAGAKRFGQIDDRKLYLPPSEENTLGKRMAHAFYYSSRSYSEISGITMMGGRGIEFLYNTSPENKETIDNVIKANVINEYTTLYDHSPDYLFGAYFDPEPDKIKNIFVAGEDVDCLYKVSPDYVNEDCKKDCAVKNYSAAVKAHGNTPVDQEYRRIIKAIQDYCEEEEEMSNHPELYLKPGKDNMNHFSRGAILAAGRLYFADYLRENNLSITDVQDEELRDEISDFMHDPVQTFHDNHFAFTEDGLEDLEKVHEGFASAWKKSGSTHARAFAQKFNENNNKPRGYNVGKDIETILVDNRGGWWERFRGTTSQQYRELQKASSAAIDPESPTYGDKEAMYIAAKAYRAYKLPEGRSFNSLSKTAKKRIEYCDSVIAAYEQEKAEREAANNPAANENVNNNIINQEEFQHQLQNNLAPKEAVKASVEERKEASAEKDPPEEDPATV